MTIKYLYFYILLKIFVINFYFGNENIVKVQYKSDNIYERIKLFNFTDCNGNVLDERKNIAVKDYSGQMLNLEKDDNAVYYNSNSIGNINLTILVPQDVTNFNSFFNCCTNLLKIDFSQSQNIIKMTDVNNMFENCVKLEEIDFAKKVDMQINSFDFIFFRCLNLKKILNFDYSWLQKINSQLHSVSGIENLEVYIFSNDNMSFKHVTLPMLFKNSINRNIHFYVENKKKWSLSNFDKEKYYKTKYKDKDGKSFFVNEENNRVYEETNDNKYEVIEKKIYYECCCCELPSSLCCLCEKCCLIL